MTKSNKLKEQLITQLEIDRNYLEKEIQDYQK